MAPASTSSVVSVWAALSVYAESLVSGARVLVLHASGSDLEGPLLELGARSVHVYDPERGEPEVRDGAFDLALVPDLGTLRDAAGAVRRLRRLVDGRGTVIALGRAVTEDADSDTFPEVAPAALGYAQLYDLFALQFESVTMTGVLPFTGVVFAELGGDEDVAVSVDTRLAPPGVPGTFVVVASREARELDPYAIVQIEPPPPPAPPSRISQERDLESGPALAAARLKADLLTAQVDELRLRLAAAASNQGERGPTDRLERLAAERDVAVTRAQELEGVLAAAQQAIAILEQRFVQAEQAMLERDDLLAALRGELDALRAQGVELGRHDPEIVAQLRARAEHAESALALNVADLAHVAEAHASETAVLEAQLRERARVVAAMEKELGRREQLVRELVGSLEEARDANGAVYQHAPALPSADPEELARLRRKLDELALEVARREGELVAQQWRIQELERASQDVSESAAVTPVPTGSSTSEPSGAQAEVAQLRDELDALRQALTQEHAARVAAESGEELSRARAELARQAALLEQMRARGPHAG